MNVGVFVGALGGASVEFFETAAIAYAIARSGYQREAYWGTITGLVLVGVAAAILGTELQFIPLRILQVVIGLVLVWFGWGWVKKSVLRQALGKRAGWVSDPLTSEGISLESSPRRFSRINFIIMTKSSALEALEVAIVVVTLGLASRAWSEALLGTGLALLLTVGVVAVLHGHLLKVPEVLLKLGAGVMLMAFGTFWLGRWSRSSLASWGFRFAGFNRVMQLWLFSRYPLPADKLTSLEYSRLRLLLRASAGGEVNYVL